MNLDKIKEYIPHSALDNLQIQITICKILDEKKILHQQQGKQENLEVMITGQLIVNNKPIYPIQQTQFTNKLFFDQNLIFNYKYKDLTYNTILAITLWSAHKKKNPIRPLGSTTVSFFDEKYRLRQDKYQLYIWMDTLPDMSYKSTTPGLVTDKNLKKIKQLLQSQNQLNQSQLSQNENQQQVQTQLALIINQIQQKIPAAFLEIQFPNFECPILYQEIEYPQSQNQIFIQESQFSKCIVVSDFDYEYQRDDLIQEQQALLLRDDKNPEKLTPNREQLAIIEKSIKNPILREINQDEKLLFYRFRYSLQQNPEALVKFLHSVNWSQEKEEKEAIKLLKLWAPCHFGDALHLLSSFFCANDIYNKKYKKPYQSVTLIRKYACDNLEKCDDQTICSFLLQLVQALKYEPLQYQNSYLAQFLMNKAEKNTEIAVLLYWYIYVECDNYSNADNVDRKKINEWYDQVLTNLLEFLQENNKQNYQVIQTQISFREELKQMVKSLKGKERTVQIEMIKQTLKDDRFKSPHFQKHPFCLNPKQILIESIHDKSTVFKSAMAPIKMTFLAHSVDNPQQKSEVELIYKNGDDLRQDQLVIQILNLMDKLLKDISQDFKLMPYNILACSKNDGFMQFVPNSTTIQDVLKNDKNILNHFEKLIQNPKNPLYDPFRDQVMENYMLSCAGYSIITYFLGVGDRHLENLMIDITGRFFHIDFGFILGKDPKPYPPPLKLCKQMVEGMGGIQSQFYQQFKVKCVNAYIYLRKYAKLIVNLFYLMIDSGIKDINIEALEKLVDKFNLDSNDQQVELHFLNILGESVNALFPIISDMIHKWATYWRA